MLEFAEKQSRVVCSQFKAMRGGAFRDEADGGGIRGRRRPLLLFRLQGPHVLGGRVVRQGAAVARERHAALLGRMNFALL